MSKGDGLKIGIKFTEDLVGDVTGSKDAFTVTGKEYQYVNGPLVDKEYQVERVERYPIQRVWELGEIITLDSDVQINQGAEYAVDTDLLSGGQPLWVEQQIFINKDAYLYGLSTVSRVSGTHTIKLLDKDKNELWQKNSSGTGSLIVAFDELFLVEENDEYYIRVEYPLANNVYRLTTAYFPFVTDLWTSGTMTIPTGTFNNILSIGLIEAEVTIIYSSLKAHTSQVKHLNGEYRIRWQETKPENTDILIEYTTGETQGQWQEIDNGEVINVDTNLWIRATLSTEDEVITPILEDLWLEEPDAPQDKILLTMDWWGRFNNVEGELTVNYDAVKGSLSGRGGAVESFTETFTPTDLVPKPNPNVVETIISTPSINTAFAKVAYNNRYASDYIVAKSPSITVVFINVDDINP